MAIKPTWIICIQSIRQGANKYWESLRNRSIQHHRAPCLPRTEIFSCRIVTNSSSRIPKNRSRRVSNHTRRRAWSRIFLLILQYLFLLWKWLQTPSYRQSRARITIRYFHPKWWLTAMLQMGICSRLTRTSRDRTSSQHTQGLQTTWCKIVRSTRSKSSSGRPRTQLLWKRRRARRSPSSRGVRRDSPSGQATPRTPRTGGRWPRKHLKEARRPPWIKNWITDDYQELIERFA